MSLRRTSRLAELAGLLEFAPPGASRASLTSAFAERLGKGVPSDVWLALAVLRGSLPTSDEVDAVQRGIVVNGPVTTARRLLGSRGWLGPLRGIFMPRVQVVSGVLVDVHHTSQTRLATGIQRVVRNVIDQWVQDRAPTLVRWDKACRRLRPLSSREHRRLAGRSPARRVRLPRRVSLIPREALYILPELAAERERTLRLAALGAHSGNTCAAIGFDCVPLTTAETASRGMGGLFAHYLAALAHFDLVAAISGAAGEEYRGWKKMLVGTGLAGPAIDDVLLPGSIGESTPKDEAEALALFQHGALPIILCVGSHEPRKNHLAVLAAAEILWRAGHEFSLGFVGGNAWRAQQFVQQVKVLQQAGRPITTASRLSDRLLWASYRIAAFTVFPSLNEGFGLPVAESLMAGTPVVTSNFGSMRELAAGGGAVLVNPRSDPDLAHGMARLLSDPETLVRLREEARRRTPRSWGDYASELWERLSDAR